MKEVIFMALSMFSKDDNNELSQCKLFYEDANLTELGSYYYQLEPILTLYEHENRKPDSIVILCTDKTLTDKEICVNGVKENISEEEYFRKIVRERWSDTEIITVRVNEKNEVETVKGVINEIRKLNTKNEKTGMKLSIDIHGGLRDTQIIVQNIISLLRFEKIVPDELYTVAFDSTKKEGIIKRADKTYDITQYVTGMNEFLVYGRADTLENYYKGSNKEIVRLIKEISDSIQLCHILKFDKAIRELKKYTDTYQPQGDYNDLFIESIKTSYGELMDPSGRNMVMNKVKWCVDNDFIQQALTIIESQMPHELYQRNILTYKYDDTKSKKVNLYVENGKGITEEMVELKEVLEEKKQWWEQTINFAFNSWVQTNCGNRVKNKEGRYIYESKIKILGIDERLYTESDVKSKCLTKPVRINLKGNGELKYVNLMFSIYGGKFCNDDIKNLYRLLVLHYALKQQRNESNHAKGMARATVEEVKVALNAYIELTRRIFLALERIKKTT